MLLAFAFFLYTNAADVHKRHATSYVFVATNAEGSIQLLFLDVGYHQLNYTVPWGDKHKQDS
jgi:hypothetical protein